MGYKLAFASLFAGSLVVCGAPLDAQGGKARTAAAATGAGPTKLDKSALQDRLDRFRREIGAKTVSARLQKRGKKRVDKWLRGFQVIQSEHYLVYTNGPKTTSKRFAKSLEQLYGFVQELWPFADVDHHLAAYIFARKSEYVDFCVHLRGWSKQAAERTAGHANGAYYATYYQSPKSRVVMHEATHQIVHACLKVPGVGSWFQEGMAVYVENAILGGKVSSGMRADLRNGHYYPFPRFVTISRLIGDTHSRRNYRHAGCLIEFLMKSKDPRLQGRFPKFLQAARRGHARGARVAKRLFEQVYGMSLEEVDAAFLAFHRVKPRG